LRFTRDKRGYENTFVVHTHGSGRRRGKPRSRILYWFRTPPGVRIGRSALDEDAIKLIEQHNPDVEFDWTRILKGQDDPGEPRGGGQQERRTQQRPRDVPSSQPVESVAVDEPFQQTTVVSDPPLADDPAVEETHSTPDAIESSEVAVVEEFLIEPRVEPPPPRPQAGDALSAVEARLGSEGLARLRARYSEVLARISDTVSDPARQEELKNTAERLNPDTWVTEADVKAGLEDYESVFESLRSVVGRRRRRGRRGRKNASEISQSDSSVPSDEAEPGDEPESAEQQ
jgi:hypothetical protein